MAYKWVPVKSSAVLALSFVETGTFEGNRVHHYGDLHIAYINGSVYRYSPMLKECYEALLYADSIGRALSCVLPRKSGEYMGKRRPARNG